MNPTFLRVSLVVLASIGCSTSIQVATAEAESADRPGLVYAVQSSPTGKIKGRDADIAVNPASVVKLATTLWALETLGPDHRFETQFELRGSVDRSTRTLHGDLVILGGADPDFHVENAYLVANALNRADVHEVTGKLRIEGPFWIGWEGGSAKRATDPSRRRRVMIDRMSEALDPERWTPATRRSIEEFEQRRGMGSGARPRVVIHDGEGARENAPLQRAATHLSGPLRVMLKRFNAYSNNDIDRFGEMLGSPAELSVWIRERVGGTPILLETLSGLGSNRMTPRQIVALLGELAATCEAAHLELGDLLPVAGCDPGTLEGFDRLATRARGAVVAKTGTLTRTDGGVSALAGTFRTGKGERTFAAIIPGSGTEVAAARRTLETWLLDRLENSGGAQKTSCGPVIVHSDRFAEVKAAD